MKIVLDTNVLVSGLLNPYGPPGRIVQMVAAGWVSVCFDARVLCEYHDVLLRPKFDFRPEHVDSLLEQIRFGGVPTMAGPLTTHLPDRSDEPFLEVAISASVACLVTGNPRHYPSPLRGGIRVVSPAKFLEIMRDWQAEP